MAMLDVLLLFRCDSNWLHADAKQDSYEIVCCDAKQGFHDPPCYQGMGLSPVLTSAQVCASTQRVNLALEDPL